MKKIIAILVIIMQTLSAAVTSFYYAPGSPKSSYIAQAVTTTLSPGSEWTFYNPYRVYDSYNAIGFNMRGPQYSGQWWDIQLWAPKNGLLEVGIYTATRFPFQDQENTMGFDWSGCGRGCNMSLSYVNILEVEYVNGLITKFAVDFVQAEEVGNRALIDFNNDRWAQGSFRYDSEIPINTAPIPEPSMFALIGLSLGFVTLRRRK